MAARFAFFVGAIALLLLNTHAHEEGGPKFSYSSDTGPDNWGLLSPLCLSGKSQSPIDIVQDKLVSNNKLKPLRREYQSTNATLLNKGYVIELQLEDAGVLIADDKNYTLLQMHWHAPSEHKINGVLFDAELHMVHKGSDGNLAVVAILYEAGRADPLIAKIQSKLAELAKDNCGADEVSQAAVGKFDTWTLKRNTRKYHRYLGSLTTPPCSENVIWHVTPKVRSISKDQIELLKAPLLSTCKSNNRPVQSLNDRQVELFNELN